MQKDTEQHSAVSTALRALATEDEKLGASTDVERRLLREVRSIAVRRRSDRTAFVLALAVALVLAIPLWRASGPANTAATEITTAFLPLRYSNVPASALQMVRMEFPERALEAFGLAPAEALEPSRTVLADVLIGEDGLARAVRFVRPILREDKKP